MTSLSAGMRDSTYDNKPVPATGRKVEIKPNIHILVYAPKQKTSMFGGMLVEDMVN